MIRETAQNIIFYWKNQGNVLYNLYTCIQQTNKMVDAGLVELYVFKVSIKEFPQSQNPFSNYKIAQCVREKISKAVQTNPALSPTDISCEKRLGFIPSTVDGASSHSGKLSLEIKKSKHKNGLLDHNWSPMKFEEVADEVDKGGSEFGGGGGGGGGMMVKHFWTALLGVNRYWGWNKIHIYHVTILYIKNS